MLKYCLILFLSFILFACKSKSKLVTTETAVSEIITDGIVQKLQNNNIDYQTLSTKFTGEFKNEEQNISFKANIRNRKDSLIWISITAIMGIEAARIAITPDSVLFLNKINKTYYKSSIVQLAKLAKAPLDFFILQDLIAGNLVDQVDSTQMNLYQLDTQYVLTGLRNKDLKKTQAIFKTVDRYEKKGKIEKIEMARFPDISPGEEENFLMQSTLFGNDFKKVRQYQFIDPKSKRFLEIKYISFLVEKNITQPSQISIILGNEKVGSVKGEYTPFEINSALSYPIQIPSGYKPFEIK